MDAEQLERQLREAADDARRRKAEYDQALAHRDRIIRELGIRHGYSNRMLAPIVGVSHALIQRVISRGM